MSQLPLILYGPLAQEPLLREILAETVVAKPSKIPGFSLIEGVSDLPGLSEDPQAVLPVMVLTDLSDEARARLIYYLEVHNLRRVPQQVILDHAVIRGDLVLCPAAQPKAEYRPENWHYGQSMRQLAVDEIMSYQGQISLDTLRGRLPTIMMRAASRATGAMADRHSASGLTGKDVEVLERKRPYSNYFTVEELTYRHRRFDGTMSEPINRAVFMAADAVTVLPYDPKRDRVLLVEQVRAAPIARNDPHPWLLEPIAGRIEPGDTPEETAHKESEEEAGLKLHSLHPISDYYPSTGCFSEYLYSYVAVADLPDDAAGLGGVFEEGEDIRAHILTREDLLHRIDANEIPDGPIILSAWWLDRNLDKLRATSG